MTINNKNIELFQSSISHEKMTNKPCDNESLYNHRIYDIHERFNSVLLDKAIIFN
jgi:hypothetical protein